jgi:glucosamine--fructose-6-phosphate aminotransferase (isomerizing)
MSLHDEILDQPDVLANLLRTQWSAIARIAESVRSQRVKYIFLAARGTSDNAGRYANYLWGAFNGLPVALATPSLFTHYGQPPKLSGALVVGVSQSGQSPDIVSVLQEGRHQGCPTLAITNAPDSPLAKAADLVIDISAREERAVAATKTYTAELMAMAMFSAALSPDETRAKDLKNVPAWAKLTLALDSEIERLAQRYRYMERCVVIGRGFNYSTAFEFSLKLKELSYVVAEPYSSADFQHGPIAMVERGFPVMAVAPDGAVFEPVLELLTALRSEHRAELLVISDRPEALGLAQAPIALPPEMPEWLTPLIAILPGQLLAYHLTRAKGYDTEQPRTIRKVTETS